MRRPRAQAGPRPMVLCSAGVPHPVAMDPDTSRETMPLTGGRVYCSWHTRRRVALGPTAVLSILQPVRVSPSQEERHQDPPQGGQGGPGTHQVSPSFPWLTLRTNNRRISRTVAPSRPAANQARRCRSHAQLLPHAGGGRRSDGGRCLGDEYLREEQCSTSAPQQEVQ